MPTPHVANERTETRAALVKRILRLYGVKTARMLPEAKGYRNTSYPFIDAQKNCWNLIIYKTEPGILSKIKNANYVSDYAASCGFPTRTTKGPITRLRGTYQETYAAMYNFLPGRTIPWEAYGKKHLKLLGRYLSNLHATLAACPKPTNHVIDECLATARRMETYFASRHIQRALRQKLSLRVKKNVFKNSQQVVAACKLLPDQTIHMDFVRGNVLFNTSTSGKVDVSGILDFEKVASGPRLFDIARTMSFLLVDCKTKTAEKIEKYFLLSGYGKYGSSRIPRFRLRDGSRTCDALPLLINYFLLYDFYKFLRHNPYETLSANEHFTRTRDLLLQRGLLLTDATIKSTEEVRL